MLPSGGRRRWPATMFLAAALVLLQPCAAPAEQSATDRVRARADFTADLVGATAEVAFGEPVRCAVIASQTGKLQRLYRAGEPMPVSAREGSALKIQRIERGRIQVLAPSGHTVWVAVGRTIPGTLAWTLVDTPDINLIEYRYVWTGRAPDVEPHLIAIHGGRATLEVELAGAPDPHPSKPAAASAVRRLDQRLLSKLRLTATEGNTYEISPADFRAALDEAGEVLSDHWPSVSPSFAGGLGVSIDSAMCNGILGASGFKVTSPKLAERAGIELGDIIVAVNGSKVNSFGDVFNIYQRVRGNGQIGAVQVNLIRRGQPLSKTYRIR